MGRIGITYQDVEQAAAELQGQQRNLTVDNVRDVLGTGSKSTIAKFLREWKAHHGLNSHDDGTLPVDLLALVKGLWESVQGKAALQITDYQREAESKLTQLQQDSHQAKQLASNLQATLHQLEEQLAQKEKNNQQLNLALISAEQEKAKMAERITLLNHHRQEQTTETDRLHQLLKHVQNNLEHYQQESQKLRQQQALLLEKQRNEYEQKLLQMTQQQEQLIKENAHHQAQCDELQKNYSMLKQAHQLILEQKTESQAQYHQIKSAHEQLQKAFDHLTEKYQQQTTVFEENRATNIALTEKTNTQQEKITDLKAELAKAEDKIQALRSDYQFSSHEKANLEGQVTQLQNILSSKLSVAA